MSNLQILADRNHARFGEFPAVNSAGAVDVVSFAPGQALPDRTLVLLSGWAARQRRLPDGRRQILKLHLPGDLCGLFADTRPADPPVALTQTQAVAVAFAANAASEGPMRAILEFEEWCLFNQLMRLGAMTAKERMAHLLLEVYHRLAAVKLARDWSFEMPLTQEQLADVLGLSGVHINRTLQTLRREALIDGRGVHLRLAKPDALAEIAHFARPEMLKHLG
jgi:CRP-like cAMP-binding protein